jgi:crossover junction endodeoxyribonuclease RuvC
MRSGGAAGASRRREEAGIAAAEEGIMITVVGIDPGASSGGVAVIDDGGVVSLQPMPDMWELAGLLRLRAAEGPFRVYIEKAQSFPKQGISSTFSYGDHFGQLQGLCIALNIPFILVPPGLWTRAMHVGAKGDDPKRRSLEVVKRLFPNVPLIPKPKKTPHLGMVDALLIAAYGRSRDNGRQEGGTGAA